MSTRRLFLGSVLVLGFDAAVACSAKDDSQIAFGTPTGSGSTTAAKPIGSDTGSGGGSQTNGDGSSRPGAVDISANQNDDGTGGSRPQRCEDPDDPDTCTCVNIASVGQLAHYGTGENDTTVAFMEWLDTKSNAGQVTLLDDREDLGLNADDLAQFDILVLQHMTDDAKAKAWEFTDEEIEAVETWVTEKGGAIIALTGYESTNTYEVSPTNQLLSFSGIQINEDDLFGPGAEALDDCNFLVKDTKVCSCWGGPQVVTEWNQEHPITQGDSDADPITAEPIFRGRSVDPGDGGEVVVNHRGKVIGVAKQVGAGRVFVYGDEWITYTSQWQSNEGKGEATSDNNCYDSKVKKFRTAATMFQVGRLWYNAIRWVQPMDCFEIEDLDLLL